MRAHGESMRAEIDGGCQLADKCFKMFKLYLEVFILLPCSIFLAVCAFMNLNIVRKWSRTILHGLELMPLTFTLFVATYAWRARMRPAQILSAHHTCWFDVMRD
jgi:hypothetical protein